MIDWPAIISGTAGVLIGAIITFGLWHYQDRTARRREWIANHLRETYLKLVDASTVPQAGDGQSFEKKKLLAAVVNEINLLGEAKTIEIAVEIAQKIEQSEETGEWVSYSELLEALRNQLRSELGMKPVKKIAVMHAFLKPVEQNPAGKEKIISADGGQNTRPTDGGE